MTEASLEKDWAHPHAGEGRDREACLPLPDIPGNMTPIAAIAPRPPIFLALIVMAAMNDGLCTRAM